MPRDIGGKVPQGQMIVWQAGRRERSNLLCLVLLTTWLVPAAFASGQVYWNTDASGAWMTGTNWTTGVVPGLADDVVIDRAGARPTVTFTYNQSNYGVNSILVNDVLVLTGGVINVTTQTQVNDTLQLAGGELKGGTLNAGPSGQITVVPGGSSRLDSITINANVSVQSGAYLNLSGSWRNNGVLTNAGQLALQGSFRTTDLGTIASTGSVYIYGSLNNTGTNLALTAGTGSWMMMSGGSMTGGTITTAGGAKLRIYGGTLDGVTINNNDTSVEDGAYVWVQNGLTVSGTMKISPYSNPTSVVFGGGSQTLGGSGRIVMSGGEMRVFPGSSLTIGPNISIEGGGSISSNGQTLINQGRIIAKASIGVQAWGHFKNEGLMEAATGGKLIINIGQGAGWNTGEIRVSGGTLTLQGSFDQASLGTINRTGGTVNIQGTVNNTGSTFTLDDSTGSWTLLGICKIVGGCVVANGSAKLLVACDNSSSPPSSCSQLEGGVVLDTPVAMGAATYIRAKGGLVLNKTLTMDGSYSNSTRLWFEGSQTLSGSGEIAFINGSSNVVAPVIPESGPVVDSNPTLTIGPGITIRTETGGGTLGQMYTGYNIVNQGTVSAQTSGKTIKLTGATFTNQGTIQAKAGGTVAVVGMASGPTNITNYSAGTLTGGTWTVGSNSAIRIPGANITTNAATIVLDGPGSGFYNASSGTSSAVDSITHNADTGSLTITNGRNLALASLVNDGSVTVGPSSLLSLAGGWTQGPGGELVFQITGKASNGLYGKVQMAGSAVLDGSLTLEAMNGFSTKMGDTVQILQFAGATGQFDSLNLPDLPEGLWWDASRLYTSGSLSVVPEPATLSLLVLGGMAMLKRRKGA